METIVLNVEEKKERKFNKKDILVGAGVIGAAVLGYIVGSKYTKARIADGIAVCWEKDPTLKDHMWQTTCDVLKDMS